MYAPSRGDLGPLTDCPGRPFRTKFLLTATAPPAAVRCEALAVRCDVFENRECLRDFPAVCVQKNEKIQISLGLGQITATLLKEVAYVIDCEVFDGELRRPVLGSHRLLSILSLSRALHLI